MVVEVTPVGTNDYGLHADVSVVIPVYLGAKWILGCLESLQKQTLSHDRFEIVLVFNGPEDGAICLAEEYFAAHPSLRVRILHSEPASAPHARNVGTASAQGDYITWVDCDDQVSAEYLELLLNSARPGKIPLAQIVNVNEDGSLDDQNLINSSMMALDEHLVSPTSYPRGLSFMVCKLLPSWMAKEVPFDTDLRSGEDVALFARIFARHAFEFSLLPALAGAKYYRMMREQSVSRQSASYDFLVTQRLDVISSLNQTLSDCRIEANQLVKSFINSQASFIIRYVKSNPSEASLIFDQLAARRLAYFPWTNLFSHVDRLIIAYNFVPYADTGGMVAAKRVRAAGQPVDVVTHKMDDVRGKNDTHYALAQPYVQFVAALDGKSTFGNYGGISEFCAEGLHAISKWTSMGRRYSEIYSRAMWPASHFLAALYKIRNPQVRWVAEFSDPIQLDSTGKFRSAPIEADSLVEEILAALAEDTRNVLASNMNVYFWAEHLAYILADELVFTNHNQLAVMAEYADGQIAGSIVSKSNIQAQPTLGSSFYQIEPSGLSLDSNYVNIGYFGEFYPSRNLNEVLQALDELAQHGVGGVTNLRLYVFTSDVQATLATVSRFPKAVPSVRVEKPLGYFRFLRALTEFDCLIVNDAVTDESHSVNPYLPSKLSDYKGAGTPIWALVEPGSILSELDHEYVTRIGDVEGARRILSAFDR